MYIAAGGPGLKQSSLTELVRSCPLSFLVRQWMEVGWFGGAWLGGAWSGGEWVELGSAPQGEVLDR